MKKILMVTNIIAPYRIVKYNEINKQIKDDFCVWFMSETEQNRKWKIDYGKINFPYEVLKGFTINLKIPIRKYLHINPGFYKKLVNYKPDIVIVGGYDSVHYFLTSKYTKRYNKKLIISVESHELSSRMNNKIITKIKRYAISLADSYIASSILAKEYLINLGADKEKINIVYNTVDNNLFHINADFSNRDIEAKNIKEVKKFIYVGRLEEEKGLKYGIMALNKINYNWELSIVGDGTKREMLENMVNKLGIKKRVNFMGFLSREEIAKLYFKSDFFLFPTLNDPCPLVVNEALLSGLFCLISKLAGNTKDFIIEGKNGYIFDPYDIDDIVDKINLSLKLKDIDKYFIRKSIYKASPENIAKQFIKALK